MLFCKKLILCICIFLQNIIDKILAMNSGMRAFLLAISLNIISINVL